MTKEELIAFLRENLSVECSVECAKYGDGRWTEIRLILDGEVISSTEIPSEVLVS